MRLSTAAVITLIAAASAASASPLQWAKYTPTVPSAGKAALFGRSPGGKPKYVNRPGGKREPIDIREWAEDALVARIFEDWDLN